MKLTQLPQGIERPEQAGLVAAGLSSATVVASQLLPQTVITALVLTHAHKVMAFSGLVAAASLASALHKTQKSERQQAPVPKADESEPVLSLVPISSSPSLSENRARVWVEATLSSGETVSGSMERSLLQQLLAAYENGELPPFREGNEIAAVRWGSQQGLPHVLTAPDRSAQTPLAPARSSTEQDLPRLLAAPDHPAEKTLAPVWWGATQQNLPRLLAAPDLPAKTPVAPVRALRQHERLSRPPCRNVSALFSHPRFMMLSRATVAPPPKRSEALPLIPSTWHPPHALPLDIPRFGERYQPPVRLAPSPVNDLGPPLSKYLKEHGSSLTPARAIEYAKEGQQLYQAVMGGGSVDATPDNALAILWHLVGCQILQEGRPSSEWSFKIHDPGGYLTQFFKTVEGCKARKSSHLKHFSIHPHMGFDLPDPRVTPAYKRHVLVIELDPAAYSDQKVAFIKLENWGVGDAVSAFMHLVEFVEAQYRKCLPGGDEQGDWRKEHLPEEFKQLFGLTPIRKLDLDRQDVQDLLKEYGYNPDTAYLRDGNEVLLKDVGSFEYPTLVDGSLSASVFEESAIWLREEGGAERLKYFPELLPAVLGSVTSREKVVGEIESNLTGVTLRIGDRIFDGSTAEELIGQISKKLDVTNRLSWRIARLMTSSSTHELLATPPQEHSDEEGSILYEANAPIFAVTRDSRGLRIVGTTGTFLQKNEKSINHLQRTLEMDPLALTASCRFQLRGFDEIEGPQ